MCIYSCRQVETLTPSLHFYLIFSNSDNSEKLNVEVVKGTVNVVNTDIKNSVFDISLSGVRGGYSEFLGYKFNIHDGMEYKRIKIFKNGNLYKEFSYNELIMLNPTKVDSIDVFQLKLR